MGREPKITVDLSSHYIDFWQISFYPYHLSFRLLSFDKSCTQLIKAKIFACQIVLFGLEAEVHFQSRLQVFMTKTFFFFLFSIFIFSCNNFEFNF